MRAVPKTFRVTGSTAKAGIAPAVGGRRRAPAPPHRIPSRAATPTALPISPQHNNIQIRRPRTILTTALTTSNNVTTLKKQLGIAWKPAKGGYFLPLEKLANLLPALSHQRAI